MKNQRERETGRDLGMKHAREELRARIGALEGRRELLRASVDGGEIDRWLGGGLTRGRVHAVAGSGATAFVAVLCARLPGPVLWCVVEGGPFPPLHPPGFAALGLDPHRLVMARTDSETAALGAAETGLREPGLAAVVVETAGELRSVHGRRLQLAAESGGGLGFVFLARARDMGWAESGWETTPVPGRERGPRWRWALRRVRRARPREWLVEWNDATGALRVVSPIGDGVPDPVVPGRRAIGSGGRAWRHDGGGGIGGGGSRGSEPGNGMDRRPRKVSVPAGESSGPRT